MAYVQSVLSKRNPGMMLFLTYVIVTVVSAVVIYLANKFFPEAVVLGTMSLSVGWAIALSAGKLGLVTTFASAFFNEFELRRGKLLSPSEMIAGYFVVNVATLWFISRFAEVFGLGLSSWVVVLALAFVADMLQGMAVMAFQAMLPKK